jgi:hypothetical protein
MSVRNNTSIYLCWGIPLTCSIVPVPSRFP